MKVSSNFSKKQIAMQLAQLFALFAAYGALAFLCRTSGRQHGMLREISVSIRDVSRPYPDLFEHFSSGIALTLIMAFAVWLLLHVLIPSCTPSKPAGPPWYGRLHRWVLHPSLHRDQALMVAISCVLAPISSWSWELNQEAGTAAYAFSAGHLQLSQIGADHLGTIVGGLIVFALVGRWHRITPARRPKD